MDGLRVDMAVNGEIGLHMGLTGDYDLVILDLMLPKINGFEICKKIRERKIYRY